MILTAIKSIFSIKDLRTKIFATLALVLVYKFLSVITIPGVNIEGLDAIIDGQK
jgi:preprotein translocase subunit SecY